MIYDKLENFYLYENCHVGFKQAREFLTSVTLDIEPGEYKLKDGVIAKVELNTTRYEAPFEGHEKYIDIHLAISGAEIIEYAPKSGIELLKEDISKPEEDLYFYNAPTNTSFLVNSTHFAVFFPTDLHKPLIIVNNNIKEIKKVVIKIPI